MIVCVRGRPKGFANVHNRILATAPISSILTNFSFSFVTFTSSTFPSASIVTAITTFPDICAVLPIAGYVGVSMCLGQSGSCVSLVHGETIRSSKSAEYTNIFIGPPEQSAYKKQSRAVAPDIKTRVLEVIGSLRELSQKIRDSAAGHYRNKRWTAAPARAIEGCYHGT